MTEKTGLVLEGGAMRGMYTAGVLDTFTENCIDFDGVIGVSAGALFGINYLSRQAGRVIRYNKKYNKDRKYMGIIPLLKEGNLFDTEYAYERVPKKEDP
ncbi:MAG: patatin-like phospholipase family protein, partial [Parasporobacterium sp.]|nr:patatin-like phospholipase family protein [Parasporobacterium sp.]